jgi:hypothetical protein
VYNLVDRQACQQAGTLFIFVSGASGIIFHLHDGLLKNLRRDLDVQGATPCNQVFFENRREEVFAFIGTSRNH